MQFNRSEAAFGQLYTSNPTLTENHHHRVSTNNTNPQISFSLSLTFDPLAISVVVMYSVRG